MFKIIYWIKKDIESKKAELSKLESELKDL
jgi:hypothetical protein